MIPGNVSFIILNLRQHLIFRHRDAIEIDLVVMILICPTWCHCPAIKSAGAMVTENGTHSWAHNQNLVNIFFPVIMIQAGLKFAHITAQHSWHLQNWDLIGLFVFKNEQHELNVGIMTSKTLCEIGPKKSVSNRKGRNMGYCYKYSVLLIYIVVRFHWRIHKRLPVTRPGGPGMGCHSWVQCLIEV